MLEGAKNVLVEVSLPQGKSGQELVDQALSSISKIEKDLHGNNVLFTGRITTPMAMAIGHKIAHICKKVYCYVPQEKVYVEVISH